MGDTRVALVAADDSEYWISLRREAAELAGRLVAVQSGRDCLRAIEDPRIALVVLDSSLRDVAGMHLLHLVRRIRPDLGVIVTFEQSSEAEERAARQEGLLYYGDRRGTKEVAAVLRQGMTVAASRAEARGLAGASSGGISGTNGGGAARERSVEDSGPVGAPPAQAPEAGPPRGTKESV